MDAMTYLGNWMKELAQENGKLPSQDAIPDEKEALEDVGQCLPEMADRLREISASERSGQVDRNILTFLAELHASKVEEALDRPKSLCEPLTMSLSACILLILTMEFDFEYTDEKSGKRFRLSKKSSKPENLTKIIEALKQLLGK